MFLIIRICSSQQRNFELKTYFIVKLWMKLRTGQYTHCLYFVQPDFARCSHSKELKTFKNGKEEIRLLLLRNIIICIENPR